MNYVCEYHYSVVVELCFNNKKLNKMIRCDAMMCSVIIAIYDDLVNICSLVQ